MTMNAALGNMRAQYEVYLTDVMGTTTPSSEIGHVVDYILSQPTLQEEIATQLGYRNGAAEVKSVIDKGIVQSKAGNKDHPDFKAYIQVYDVGSVIAYKRHDLTMGLESDVSEAFDQISNARGRLMVFASASADSSKYGFETAGLDGKIEKYYSSGQKEIGSKMKPDSYKAIAKDAGVAISRMAYVTDDANEAKAALEAGCGKVFLINRKTDELGEHGGYTIINDYMQVAEQTLMAENTDATNTTDSIGEA